MSLFEDNTEETEEEPLIALDAQITEDEKIVLIAEVSEGKEDLYAWQWQYSEDGNEPWTDIDGATELVCDLENTEENFNRYYRLQGRKD